MSTKGLNRILAVTDLSGPARHAVDRAALLSKESGAPLDLLHVADLAPLTRLWQLMIESSEDPEKQVLDMAREKLMALAATVLKRYGVSAGTHVISGSLLSALKKHTETQPADLIVCGSRGEGFMRHLSLGSSAERMLSATKYPVLVVKQDAHEPYRTLLVPVDFSPSSLKAIKDAQAVAPSADIVLLHVFDVPFEGHMRYASVDEKFIAQYRYIAMQEGRKKFDALIEGAGFLPFTVRSVLLHGDPSLRIIEQEQEFNCDLIVMGKHGANMLEELFLGSVTKRVLADSQCDVLVSV